MPLRCAIVPPTPVPYREPLFRALHERDELDVRVIYQSAAQPGWDAPAEWFPTDHPYPAVHLRSLQRRRAGRTPVQWPHGLERALAAAEPDCVVVSEYGAASLRVLRWCRRRGRAYVIFTECTPQIDSMLPRWQLELHRRLARRADGLIATSSAARDRLRAFGVPDERIRVALQAADVQRFRNVAATEHAGAPLTVLGVGRLVPDKNFARLIEAFSRAAVEARLEVVGTGFLETELKALAARHRVPVHFHGHVEPGRLSDLYATADVYALVSTYEPFGVAVREAAAAGLPIICSRSAGAAGDVAVEGRNAILIDPRNVDEIAAALARLASDAGLRRRMSEASRAIDRETDGQEIDAFVEAVLAAAARRGISAPHPPAPTPYAPSRAGSTSA